MHTSPDVMDKRVGSRGKEFSVVMELSGNDKRLIIGSLVTSLEQTLWF